LIAGLIASLVMIVWSFVVNAVFRFNANINLKRIEGEQIVYAVLLDEITEPGRYSINPEIIPGEGYPGDAPAFSVQYSGLGHNAAGILQLYGLCLYVATAYLAVGMLSQCSHKLRSAFWSRALFFTAIGGLFALFKDLDGFNIGKYPFGDVVQLALYDIIMWTVIGLAVALYLKPQDIKLREVVE
jgi:hypothetical protein